MLKRYLLFQGETYYPDGGWNDFIGSYDSIEEAENVLINKDAKFTWWHIVDSTTEEIVRSK